MTGSEPFENPSAGKFDPPPGQGRFEAPTSKRGPQWFALALTAGALLVRYQLDHVHTTGWMVPVLLIGVPVADYLLRRAFRSERGEPDPNMPQQNVPR